MAQSRYNPEDFGAAPTLNTPGAQQIRATPEAFGGRVAQSLDRFGQDIERTSDVAAHSLNVFNHVSTDDSTTKLQAWAGTQLHGDPNVIGPDGQPDSGFLGLKGQAALDRYKQFGKDLDARIKETREGLSNEEQRRLFDNSASALKNDVIARAARHTDEQKNTYYQSVYKANADVNLTHISNNFDNPDEVRNGTTRLINARLNEVKLAGGGEEARQAAIVGAQRDAMKAWTKAIAVKDPTKALEILENGKASAGLYYDELAQEFRSKAASQAGLAAGTRGLAHSQSANGYASPTYPVTGQAVQTVPGGYSNPQSLARVIQIESGGNPMAGAGKGHVGLTQFSEETARQVGITDRHDPAQSIFGAQKYAALNRPVLVRVLNRQPTDGELYLAHQQGPGGAAKLFANPTARAGDLVGDAAIKGNGGDPNAPASAFTSMWLRKFGQNVTPTATPAAVIGPNLEMPERWQGRGELPPETAHPETIPTHPEQVLADSYRNAMDPMNYPEVIRNDPALLHLAQQHAFEAARTTYAAQQVAEQATEKAKKQASDAAANETISRIYSGQNVGNIVNEIADDPRLEWQTRHTLISIAQHEIGPDRATATRAYGKGFWKAYQQVLAPPDAPERISDVQTILNRAAPGADPEEELTLAGVQKVSEIMNSVRKSVDSSNVHEALQGQIKLAQKRLSFDQETSGYPGVPPMRDPEGEKIFHGQFLNRYLSSYDAWVQAGKNPWDFINNPKNVDDLTDQLRSKQKMQAAKIAATRQIAGGTGPDIDAANKVAAIPPPGVKPEAWAQVIEQPPKIGEGDDRLPKWKWAKMLTLLSASPTPETFKAFNESSYGTNAGNDASALYQKLTGQAPPATPEPAAPAAAPAEPQQAWAPPAELQDKAAKEKAAKEAHDRLPPWQTSGLAPWEQR